MVQECFSAVPGVIPALVNIIGDKFPGMDMISFGPTISGAHSPDERVQISAVRKFWDLLVAMLEGSVS